MKYYILKIWWLSILPMVWIVAGFKKSRVAEFSLRFACLTQGVDFSRWIFIQDQFESGYFKSTFTLKANNYSGMKAHPAEVINGCKRYSRKPYANTQFAKYPMLIDCAIDQLQWYEKWGLPVKKALSNGMQLTDIPTVLQLLLASGYIVQGDLPNYAKTLPILWNKYEENKSLFIVMTFLLLVIVALCVVYWNKISNWWRKEWFTIKTFKRRVL